MTTIRRSLAIVIVENQVVFVLQFAMAVMVARLLTPKQVGLYSIAMISLSAAQVLRDFGVAAYLIKEPELTVEKMRATSAIAFLSSWAIAVLVFAGSFPLSQFYGEPQLRAITCVLAINFVMIPFGAISMAVLRREFQMRKLFLIRMASESSNVTTAIVLAALGFGPMSLAIGNTVGTAVTVLGVRLCRRESAPLWPTFVGVRKILRFSGQTLVSNLFVEASRAAPDAILGKLAGAAAVGLYGRASGLVALFARVMSQAMWSVTLPFFSKVKRDGSAVGPALARAQSYLVGVAWPFYATLGLSAHPIILSLFGNQWIDSIPVLRWLSAFGAATAATMFASTALIGADQAAREVRMTAKVHVLRIGTVALAAPFGIVALAMWLSVAAIGELAIVSAELRRTLAVQFRTIGGIYLHSAALAAWSSLPALALVAGGYMQNLRVGGVLILASASIGFWLIGIFLLRHPIKTEVRTALAGIKSMIRSK